MKNLIFLLSILMVSCSHDELNEPSNKMGNFDLTLPFHIQNEDGLDLLNPINKTSYNWDYIKVYSDSKLTNDISGEFIVNGEGGLISGQDQGRNFIIILGMSQMGNIVNEKFHQQTYYLQLSNSDIDTVTVYASSTSNGAYLSKFVYNNDEIFKDAESKANWNGIIVK